MKMSLDLIRSGKFPATDRILLYGTEGVGKSTFGADAPSPVFIAAEDGIRHLDTSSFPEPTDYNDVLAAIALLSEGNHQYKTVVIDTLDWLEWLVWAHCCKKAGWVSIEDPGYQKGYRMASEQFKRMLVGLDRAREAGMEVILLAHAELTTNHNPAGADYSSWAPKLHKWNTALAKEWADIVLFAEFEQFVQEKKGLERPKAFATGKRLVHTERTAAFVAKNRTGLPPTLPLSYAEFNHARKMGIDPNEIIKEITDTASVLSKEGITAVQNRIAAADGNVAQLQKLLNVVRIKTEQTKKEE